LPAQIPGDELAGKAARAPMQGSLTSQKKRRPWAAV
jgi:hypothetical protein